MSIFGDIAWFSRSEESFNSVVILTHFMVVLVPESRMSQDEGRENARFATRGKS